MYAAHVRQVQVARPGHGGFQLVALDVLSVQVARAGDAQLQVFSLQAIVQVDFARPAQVDGVQAGRGDADVECLVGDVDAFLEADVQCVVVDVDVQHLGNVVGGVDGHFRLAGFLGIGHGGASHEVDAGEVIDIDFLRHVVFAFFDGLLAEPSLGACLAACQEDDQRTEDYFCFHCLIR